MNINNIYHGDCTEITKKIPDNSIDLILTDPPFNVEYNYKTYKDKLGDEEYRDWCVEWLKEGLRILKDRHFIIVFSSDKKLYWILDAVYKSGLNYQHLLKWIKPNNSRILNGSCLLNITEVAIVASKGKASKNLMNFSKLCYDTILCHSLSIRSLKSMYQMFGIEHVAQRPAELYQNIIEGFTKENDIVYDFFLGSGSTVEACIKSNRNYLGSEIDGTYINLINKRIKNLKNNKQETLF